MIFQVTDKGLKYNIVNYMSFQMLRDLTGTKIDLEKRIGRTIRAYRSKGHLYFYDEQFIEGEKYIHDNVVYRCDHINPKLKIAILSKVGNNLKVLCSKEPLEFRIA